MLTVFDQVVLIGQALYQEIGVPVPETLPKPKRAVPAWGVNIARQLKKTILKPLLKLQPKGKVVWRHYGRLVGMTERYKTFLLHDVPQVIEAELGVLTEEQAERIEPLLGMEDIRASLVKALNRPVADDEKLENLVAEAFARQFEQFDRMRQTAFLHVSAQDSKTAGQFYKGLAEGYETFLDERGNFSGDRGRANIYLILLGCMMEVEKLRRSSPPVTRPRYYDQLTPVYGLTPKAYDWFNDVCDDVKFPLNNLGRKRRSPSPIL